MDLSYLAFFLISFVPLLIAHFWYGANNKIAPRFGEYGVMLEKLSILKLILFFILSFTLVYGYMNVIIHQMGFYELFFTDIMKGSTEAKAIVDDFLAKYGNKHRHFGHGVFHGAINAFVFALPFLGILALMESKSMKFVLYHFSYWFVTSIIIGGLISQFV